MPTSSVTRMVLQTLLCQEEHADCLGTSCMTDAVRFNKRCQMATGGLITAEAVHNLKLANAEVLFGAVLGKPSMASRGKAYRA